jgi:hypothetical protein
MKVLQSSPLASLARIPPAGAVAAFPGPARGEASGPGKSDRFGRRFGRGYDRTEACAIAPAERAGEVDRNERRQQAAHEIAPCSAPLLRASAPESIRDASVNSQQGERPGEAAAAGTKPRRTGFASERSGPMNMKNTYRAQDVRQGRMVLDTPLRRAIFVAGLAGAVLLGLILAYAV